MKIKLTEEQQRFVDEFFSKTTFLEDGMEFRGCEIYLQRLKDWNQGLYEIIEPKKESMLTKENILEQGWKVIAYEKHGRPYQAFEKGNYFLMFYPNKNNLVDIILRDPSIEERVHNPEHFRFFCEVNDLETFKQLEKLLNLS